MISVIICTFNRSQALRQALDCLRKMTVPSGLPWELIVVNNNSRDDTGEVVREFSTSSSINIRYALEPKQGLCNARNKGINLAKGDILAFTDDDCLVHSTWIATIAKEFSADPVLAGVGGPLLHHNHKDRAIRTRTFKEREVLTTPRQVFKLIVGGNMAFRRSVFEKIGEFDPHLDVGTEFLSAGDSDFIYRAYKAGFKMIHSPEVMVYHNHGRRTDSQVFALNRGYVFGRGALYCKHILEGDAEALQMARQELARRAKNILKNALAGKSITRQSLLAWALISGGIRRFMSIRGGESN